MIDGLSGLLSIHLPAERPSLEASRNQLVWPNGTIAQMFAADNPDSLRGPQFDAAWCDELCKWRRPDVAWDTLQRAQRYAASATPVEQALIAALAKRYPSAAALDSASAGPPLGAYADAMKAVADRFPEDVDVATMAAEAMMNINAWKLWALDGKPTAGTAIVTSSTACCACNGAPAHNATATPASAPRVMGRITRSARASSPAPPARRDRNS